MIMIGRGALLWRAVSAATDAGHPVDLVCVPPGESAPAAVPVLRTTNVNDDVALISAACTDGIAFSLNNPTILRAQFLAAGLRTYNIHNGPLPAYRGIPEIAVVYALLNGDSAYAATLHEVDAGIDTGRVVDSEPFGLGSTDTFASVMMRGLRACQALFERNLPAVVSGRAGHPVPPPAAASASPGYYGRTLLGELIEYRNHPRFARATDLGVFAPHFPELADAVAAARPVHA